MNGHSQELTAAISTAPARERSGRRAFTMHLGEMVGAMVAGMVVLGGAAEGLLALAGASLSAASAPVAATVMAFNMTLPMVLWMRYRGHPSQHNAEMAGSMIVPTALVIGLYAVGAIASGTVLVAQHVVMIPAMVAVMLWRYEHYSH